MKVPFGETLGVTVEIGSRYESEALLFNDPLHVSRQHLEVDPVSWRPDSLCFGSPRCARRPHYAPEFRRQMVELVRAGRSPAELENEFEPTAQTIRKWVAQGDRDEGRRSDGLTTPEREELNRLRRENRQLKVEREILSKAAAWFARETNAIPSKGSSS